jgi:hypothetical protein
METSRLRSSVFALCVTFCLLVPGFTWAAQPIAEIQVYTDSLGWDPQVEAAGFSLTVSTPDGLVVRKEFGPRETPSFALGDLPTDKLDGTYGYQLDIRPLLSLDQRQLISRARLAGDEERAGIEGALPVPIPSLSGYFTVYQGAIIPLDSEHNEQTADATNGQGWATSGGLQSAPEKTVISGDLTVYNSLCVGFDCLSAESYGSDTIRLKENNLRIHFDDTSASPFPANDWRIVANSSLSGGGNFLAFEDSTAARQVFTVEAGATANSLYVDTGTRVGIGTSTPVLNLHLATGNTPGLRLEQNVSSGFAAQTWDIAGNEANFFIRDVTGGSRLPLRIRPGAPTSSIDIANDGKVGIGTAAPTRPLHVITTGAPDNTVLEVQNNGPTRIRIRNDSTGETWNFGHQSPSGTGLVLSDVGDATSEFLLDVNGNLTLAGTITVPGGTLPDYVFEDDYPLMSMDALAAFIAEHKHLPNVPSAEDVHRAGALDLVDFQRRLLEKIEELTLYTIEQQQTIDALLPLRAKQTELEARLAEMEVLLQAGHQR